MQSSAVSAGKKPQKRKCIDQLFVQGSFSSAAAALVTEPSVAVSFLKNMKVVVLQVRKPQIWSSSTVGSNFSTNPHKSSGAASPHEGFHFIEFSDSSQYQKVVTLSLRIFLQIPLKFEVKMLRI